MWPPGLRQRFAWQCSFEEWFVVGLTLLCELRSPGEPCQAHEGPGKVAGAAGESEGETKRRRDSGRGEGGHCSTFVGAQTGWDKSRHHLDPARQPFNGEHGDQMEW